MGERGAGHQVADRVDALGGRPQRAVDLDQPVVTELDAGLLEPEALDVGAAAGRDHQPVDLGRVVAERQRHLVVGALDVLHLRAGVDRDVLLAEPARGDLGDVRVLGRQHAVEHLEQEHLAAQRAVRRRDLRAGAPAPTTASVSGSASSAHASSVPMTRPPNSRPGTGLGTEPVASTIALRASISASPTRTLPSPVSEPEPSISSMPFFLNRPADAARQRLDDLLAARDDLREVDRRAVDVDAELARLLDLGQDVGHPQDRLGGMHA